MTVGELIEVLQKHNPDEIVVLASDAEGNSYSELSCLGGYLWNEDTCEIERCDEAKPPNAVCLWPAG